LTSDYLVAQRPLALTVVSLTAVIEAGERAVPLAR